MRLVSLGLTAAILLGGVCATTEASNWSWISAQKACRINNFLRAWGSPMAGSAVFAVQECNAYGIDPYGFFAVLGVESGFGKHSRGHNIGALRNGRGWRSFPSQRVAILHTIQAFKREGLKYAGCRYGNLTSVQVWAPYYLVGKPTSKLTSAEKAAVAKWMSDFRWFYQQIATTPH